MVKRNDFVFGASGAGNYWAKTHMHYTEGAKLIDAVVDVIRREGESYDCPRRFEIRHLRGGGTGSGLATLLLIKMRHNYSDRITSPNVSDVVVQAYNTTLSIHQFLENTDETFRIDNGALHNISHNILKYQHVKYAEINWVISSATRSGIAGKLNGDSCKINMNLFSFQRLHCFAIAQAPPFGPGDGKHGKCKSTR